MVLQLMPELENQVRDAAKRDGMAADAYVERVLQRHLLRRSMALPASEAELIQKINLGLSAEEWERYYELRERLLDESLSAAEQKELIGITDRIELANARRIESLVELALLRNTTVDSLMDEFGLRPAAYV